MNEIIESFSGKEKSFDINQTLKRYPFHGCSKHLIDKFLIIGYDKMVFDKVIQPSHKSSLTQRNDSSNSFRNSYNPLSNSYSFPINTEPSIINEICSDYSKELLDNEIITSLVFPNKPLGYYFDSERSKEEAKKNQSQQNYSVIFNSNPSSNTGLKKSYNGIAYIVFEKFHIPNKNEIYKIPKAFCILSEFPFYSSFYKLLQIISTKFKHPGHIPVEVFVHNIVCYTPSPINQNIKLLIPLKHKHDDLSSLSNSMSSKKTKITDIYNNNNSNRGGGDNINSNLEQLTFPLLNGLPILEYSLPKIFLYLGPQLAFKTFIFSFIEKDILVFSTNHELLSLVIYTFHSLSYPLNDGNYYWQNVSVSYQDLLSESGPFVNQSYPVMLGVHSKYNDSYINKNNKSEHFVLDLDNKTFTFVYQKETEEVKQLNYLLHFINKIIKNSSSKHNKVLYTPCKKLYTFLENEKVPRNVNVNHFYDDVDKNVNMKYQEEFYKFILGVVGLLYKNITLHSEMDSKTNQHDRNRLKESFYNEYSNEYETHLPDEKFFFEQLKGTFKFSSFIEGYVKSHNDNGLYQIPFLFLDEFTDMQIKWIDKESNINFTFLKYIQDIYSQIPNIKNNNSTQQQQQQQTMSLLVTSVDEIIDCNNFLNFYENTFAYEFYREIVDPPNKNKCLSIASNFTTNQLYPGSSSSLYHSEMFCEIAKKVEYKYEQLKLNETFLYKYKKKLRDLPQLYFTENFPWYDIIDKGNELSEVNVNYLENVAEVIYIETNKSLFNHLIIYSLFLMFALTRPLASSDELTEQIFPFSEFLDSYVSSRKYFKELLFIFKHLSTKVDEAKTKSIKGCVGLVINKLRVKGIVSSFLLTKLINDVNDSTDEAGFFDVDIESITDVKPQLSFNLSSKGMISDKEYIEYLRKDCSKVGTVSNREIVEEKENKKMKDASSAVKKSLSPKLTYPFMKTDLKNQDMPLTTPKKIFMDLFRLKNKLLYDFEDKNEEVINDTNTLIQYCVCLMFYVHASGILGECTSSMKFLLHKIIIMLENKIEGVKEQPTPE